MNALRAIRLAATFFLLWPGISAAQQPTSEPIKIGWIGHLTGVLSAYGQDMLRAAEMAVEDINANGGVLGRKLQLVVRDDRGDPSQAATLVRELDTQERVLVVSGSMSADVSKALRGYAESNQVPYISASSGDASLTAPGTKWTQRVQPPAAVQGAAMAKFALSRKPDAKLAIIRHDILYFPEVMNGAIWYAEKSGQAKIVYNQYFPPRQADFNVVAAQLKEAQPDYILFALNPPGLENFTRAVLAAGFRPDQIICFTVQTAPAQRALGKDIIGTYAATFFDESLRQILPEAGVLSDRFFASRGYYPGYIVGNAYGTVRMIAAATKASGSVEPARVREGAPIRRPHRCIGRESSFRRQWPQHAQHRLHRAGGRFRRQAACHLRAPGHDQIRPRGSARSRIVEGEEMSPDQTTEAVRRFLAANSDRAFLVSEVVAATSVSVRPARSEVLGAIEQLAEKGEAVSRLFPVRDPHLAFSSLRFVAAVDPAGRSTAGRCSHRTCLPVLAARVAQQSSVLLVAADRRSIGAGSPDGRRPLHPP